jgi:hypothetical protein
MPHVLPVYFPPVVCFAKQNVPVNPHLAALKMLGIHTGIPVLFAVWYGFAKQNVPVNTLAGPKNHLVVWPAKQDVPVNIPVIHTSDLISGS